MKEQVKYLQTLFYDVLNDYGRVYLIVKYSDKTSIGNRGFTEDEKKNGLVLIFNQKNYKNLEWTEDGHIITTLGFGASNRPEKCFICADDLVSVFSPDARVKLDRWDMLEEGRTQTDPQKSEVHDEGESGKVVSLDRFRGSKK